MAHYINDIFSRIIPTVTQEDRGRWVPYQSRGGGGEEQGEFRVWNSSPWDTEAQVGESSSNDQSSRPMEPPHGHRESDRPGWVYETSRGHRQDDRPPSWNADTPRGQREVDRSWTTPVHGHSDRPYWTTPEIPRGHRQDERSLSSWSKDSLRRHRDYWDPTNEMRSGCSYDGGHEGRWGYNQQRFRRSGGDGRHWVEANVRTQRIRHRALPHSIRNQNSPSDRQPPNNRQIHGEPMDRQSEGNSEDFTSDDPLELVDCSQREGNTSLDDKQREVSDKDESTSDIFVSFLESSEYQQDTSMGEQQQEDVRGTILTSIGSEDGNKGNEISEEKLCDESETKENVGDEHKGVPVGSAVQQLNEWRSSQLQVMRERLLQKITKRIRQPQSSELQPPCSQIHVAVQQPIDVDQKIPKDDQNTGQQIQNCHEKTPEKSQIIADDEWHTPDNQQKEDNRQIPDNYQQGPHEEYAQLPALNASQSSIQSKQTNSHAQQSPAKELHKQGEEKQKDYSLQSPSHLDRPVSDAQQKCHLQDHMQQSISPSIQSYDIPLEPSAYSQHSLTLLQETQAQQSDLVEQPPQDIEKSVTQTNLLSPQSLKCMQQADHEQHVHGNEQQIHEEKQQQTAQVLQRHKKQHSTGEVLQTNNHEKQSTILVPQAEYTQALDEGTQDNVQTTLMSNSLGDDSSPHRMHSLLTGLLSKFDEISDASSAGERSRSSSFLVSRPNDSSRVRIHGDASLSPRANAAIASMILKDARNTPVCCDDIQYCVYFTVNPPTPQPNQQNIDKSNEVSPIQSDTLITSMTSQNSGCKSSELPQIQLNTNVYDELNSEECKDGYNHSMTTEVSNKSKQSSSNDSKTIRKFLNDVTCIDDSSAINTDLLDESELLREVELLEETTKMEENVLLQNETKHVKVTDENTELINKDLLLEIKKEYKPHHTNTSTNNCDENVADQYDLMTALSRNCLKEIELENKNSDVKLLKRDANIGIDNKQISTEENKTITAVTNKIRSCGNATELLHINKQTEFNFDRDIMLKHENKLIDLTEEKKHIINKAELKKALNIRGESVKRETKFEMGNTIRDESPGRIQESDKASLMEEITHEVSPSKLTGTVDGKVKKHGIEECDIFPLNRSALGNIGDSKVDSKTEKHKDGETMLRKSSEARELSYKESDEELSTSQRSPQGLHSTPKQDGSSRISMKDMYPQVGRQDGFSGIPRQDVFTSTPRQDEFSSTHRQDEVSSTPRKGESPSTSRQDGFPITPRQNGYPNTLRQNGFPSTSRQDGFPSIPSQDVFPSIPRQDGFPNTSRQDGFPNSSTQDGFPSTSSHDGFFRIPSKDGCYRTPKQNGSPWTPKEKRRLSSRGGSVEASAPGAQHNMGSHAGSRARTNGRWSPSVHVTVHQQKTLAPGQAIATRVETKQIVSPINGRLTLLRSQTTTVQSVTDLTEWARCRARNWMGGRARRGATRRATRGTTHGARREPRRGTTRGTFADRLFCSRRSMSRAQKSTPQLTWISNNQEEIVCSPSKNEENMQTGDLNSNLQFEDACDEHNDDVQSSAQNANLLIEIGELEEQGNWGEDETELTPTYPERLGEEIGSQMDTNSATITFDNIQTYENNKRGMVYSFKKDIRCGLGGSEGFAVTENEQSRLLKSRHDLDIAESRRKVDHLRQRNRLDEEVPRAKKSRVDAKKQHLEAEVEARERRSSGTYAVEQDGSGSRGRKRKAKEVRRRREKPPEQTLPPPPPECTAAQSSTKTQASRRRPATKEAAPAAVAMGTAGTGPTSEQHQGDTPRQFEVECIVAKRRRKGKVEYLLKWLGYPDSDNSWVPAAKMDCPDLLERFKESCRGRQRGRGRRQIRQHTKVGEARCETEKKQKPGAEEIEEDGQEASIATWDTASNAGTDATTDYTDITTDTTATVTNDTMFSATTDLSVADTDSNDVDDIEVESASRGRNGKLYLQVRSAREWRGVRQMLATEANKRWPSKVIAFYQERLSFAHNQGDIRRSHEESAEENQDGSRQGSFAVEVTQGNEGCDGRPSAKDVRENSCFKSQEKVQNQDNGAKQNISVGQSGKVRAEEVNNEIDRREIDYQNSTFASKQDSCTHHASCSEPKCSCQVSVSAASFRSQENFCCQGHFCQKRSFCCSQSRCPGPCCGAGPCCGTGPSCKPPAPAFYLYRAQSGCHCQPQVFLLSRADEWRGLEGNNGEVPPERRFCRAERGDGVGDVNAGVAAAPRMTQSSRCWPLNHPLPAGIGRASGRRPTSPLPTPPRPEAAQRRFNPAHAAFHERYEPPAPNSSDDNPRQISASEFQDPCFGDTASCQEPGGLPEMLESVTEDDGVGFPQRDEYGSLARESSPSFEHFEESRTLQMNDYMWSYHRRLSQSHGASSRTPQRNSIIPVPRCNDTSSKSLPRCCSHISPASPSRDHTTCHAPPLRQTPGGGYLPSECERTTGGPVGASDPPGTSAPPGASSPSGVRDRMAFTVPTDTRRRLFARDDTPTCVCPQCPLPLFGRNRPSPETPDNAPPKETPVPRRAAPEPCSYCGHLGPE